MSVLGSPEQDAIVPEEILYLGYRGSVPCYAGIMAPGSPLPDDWTYFRVRDLFARIPDDELAIAAFAVRMAESARRNRFCGRCGNPAIPLKTERAWRCEACGLVSYPRISPAIIVLIERDGKALLARSPRFPSGLHGLIAGFVESGENLEEALAREVQEETGLSVRNIRYFGSEPWPFPDSLMLGFTAEYAGGDLVVDRNEIESASWFDRDHLPKIPERLSISRALIDWWVEKGRR